MGREARVPETTSQKKHCRASSPPITLQTSAAETPRGRHATPQHLERRKRHNKWRLRADTMRSRLVMTSTCGAETGSPSKRDMRRAIIGPMRESPISMAPILTINAQGLGCSRMCAGQLRAWACGARNPGARDGIRGEPSNGCWSKTRRGAARAARSL